MRSSGMAGCVLTAFAGPCALLLYWLLAQPTLIVILLGASFVALGANLLTALVFVMARESSSGSATAAYVLLGVFFSQLLRIAYTHAIVKAERVFRSRYQVLFSSRLRGVNVGAAIGAGFGLVQAALHFGTLVDAEAWISSRGATYFDIDSCPQLPYLFYVAITTLFSQLCSIAWGILTLQGWSAFARAVWPEEAPPPPPPAVTASAAGDAQPSTSGTAGVGVSSVEMRTSPVFHQVGSPAGTSASAGAARHRGGGSIAAAPATPPSEDQPLSPARRIPAVTSLRRGEGLACIALCIVLHLILSLTSLAASGAYDERSMAPVAGRGCLVTIPVAMCVAAVSAAAALALAKVDAVRKVNLDDL